MKSHKKKPFQIDQSGKIEDTSKSTYLALSNSEVYVLKLSSTEKRKLIGIIKEIRRPHKTYIYQIFAALVFQLLKNHQLSQVTIDTEYPGHESSIKEVLIQLFQRFKKPLPEINFGYVGKKSGAHLAAIETLRGKRKADVIVKARDVLDALYSNLSKKKGWRS